MQLKELVPPPELCKLIPAGEFADSAFVWALRKAELPYVGVAVGINKGTVVDGDHTLCTREHANKVFWGHGKNEIPCPTIPAPTFDEILDELHKCLEDVFVKWSETAYHGWLVNAYSHGRNEDYQAHDQRKTTAAIKVWLKMKGIEIQ